MMHTRAEWKMLPYRQPARGAAARYASLDLPENEEIKAERRNPMAAFDKVKSGISQLDEILDTLTDRERKVLTLRFGLIDRGRRVRHIACAFVEQVPAEEAVGVET